MVLVVGLKKQRSMLLSFIFFQQFGECALKPFICSLFFPWAYAVLALLMIFAPICTKLCIPFGLSETAVSPSSGIFEIGL